MWRSSGRADLGTTLPASPAQVILAATCRPFSPPIVFAFPASCRDRELMLAPFCWVTGSRSRLDRPFTFEGPWPRSRGKLRWRPSRNR
jgi:hypothetical protein